MINVKGKSKHLEYYLKAFDMYFINTKGERDDRVNVTEFALRITTPNVSESAPISAPIQQSKRCVG